MLGNTAVQAGELLGVGILVLVGVGVVRTLSRDDLTLREKILGKRKPD